MEFVTAKVQCAISNIKSYLIRTPRARGWIKDVS